MNDRNRNSAGEYWRLGPERVAPSWGARTARVVVVESRRMFRECLAHALMTLLPRVTIESVNSPDEVIPGPAELLLIGRDPLSGCEPEQLRDTFQILRGLSDGSPIGAYLHTHNAAVASLLVTLGAAGVVMPDASVEIVIAAVRLMIAGGTFLPPDPLDYREENEVVAPAADLSPQRVAAQAAARPNESPLLSRGLTAREHDVFKSLSAGRANKNIAFDLQISESTVKVHLRNMMKKLHATNRTEVAMHFGASAVEIASS
jgi:DNA-binding NarL/FixJ family response regulator